MILSPRTRFLFALALMIGVYLLPYWLIVPLAGAIALFVPLYLEFPALVAIEEALYAGRGFDLFDMALPLALFASFALLEISRGYLRERLLRFVP